MRSVSERLFDNHRTATGENGSVRACATVGVFWPVLLTEANVSLLTAAAKAFFRSARTVTGVIPDRVTTDGHDGYPAAIQSEFGEDVLHRTSVYLNNRLEQDHRGIKDRYRPMRGFKSMASVKRFCRAFDEVRNLLRVRSLPHQHVPADRRRLRYLRNTATILGILEAA
jgi:transposase-like protein